MSTIIQAPKANGTHKANGVHSAKRTGPLTVHAQVPAAESAEPSSLGTQERPNPCTERDALAVTLGTPRRDEHTITALIADWAAEAPGEVPKPQINIEIDGGPITCGPEQARTAATQLHRIADHIQELAGQVDGPPCPSWLTEPCPTRTAHGKIRPRAFPGRLSVLTHWPNSVTKP